MADIMEVADQRRRDAALAQAVADMRNGGSGLGYPDTLLQAEETLTDVETFITGHDGSVTRADLEEYAAFNEEFRNLVVDGFNHGLSVGEVLDRWSLPAKYAGYRADPQRVRSNVEAIFGELAR